MKKITHAVTKYKDCPKPVKASLAFTICSIIQKGIQFITVPLFTHTMSSSDYGLVTIYSSWLAVLMIFATWKTFAGGINKGMERYANNRDSFISALQGLSSVSCIATATVLIPITILFGDFMGFSWKMMVVMLLECFFTPPLLLWSCGQRYEYKYKVLVAVTLLMAVLNSAIGLVAVNVFEQKGIARILSSTLCTCVFGVIFYGVNWKKGKKLYNRKVWNYIFFFNLPMIPHYLSQLVLSQSDRIMIERFYDTSAVAKYGVAYSIGMIMSFVMDSIEASLTPWRYQNLTDANYGRIRVISTRIMIMVALVALVPIAFAPEVVAIMGTSEYKDAVYVVPPVGLSMYLIFLYGQFTSVEIYNEKGKYITYGSLISGILNIVLNAILLPDFGYIVAGYTTAISYMLLVFLHYWFMKRSCKDYKPDSIYDIKRMIQISVVLLGIIAVFTLSYQNFVVRYVLITVLGALTVVFRTRIKDLFAVVGGKGK